MLKMKVVAVASWFVTGFAFGVPVASNEDFNSLCALATEAREMSISIEESFAYISENIDKRVESKDVIDAYFSLSHVSPAARYEVFEAAAESTLGKEWNCDALKLLFKAE